MSYDCLKGDKVAKTVKKSTRKKTVKTSAAKKTVKKRAVVKKTAKKTAAKATKKAVKKPVPKKTAARIAKAKKYLTKAEIEHFRQLLLEKRLEIIGDVNSMESEALRKSRLEAGGDLSSMPIHMADIGTDNYEQEFALGLLDSERKLLQEIHDALERIEQISKKRLQASPWARYCIEYARMVEQGLVREGQPLFE